MTTSLHHSGITAKGVESVYFSNGDKTGWKTFLSFDEAEQSCITQNWLAKHELAPKVLSDVVEIEIEGKIIINPYSFTCPVSGVGLNFCGGKLQFFNYDINSYQCANCLEPLKKIKAKAWGYLTEEIDTIARDLDAGDYKDELLDKLSEIGMEGGMDLHKGNWGLLNGKPVVIDCGHYFISEAYNCNEELLKLVGSIKESEDNYEY